MQLHLNEEQNQIESSVADVLSNEYSFTQRLKSIQSRDGINPEVWKQFAGLGWLGLSLSEQSGGLGLGLIESGLLMKGLGRHLVIEPVWSSTMLTAQVLQTCAPDRIDIIERLIQGQSCAALAHPGITSIDSIEPVFDAIRTPTGYLLNGELKICPGAPCADDLIVFAKLKDDSQNRPVLFHLDAKHAGVDIESFKMLDGSRAGHIRLTNVQIEANQLLSDDPSVATKTRHAIARAMLLLCWEALGSMSAAFDQTCSYVATRTQFGRALNEFQVVQHKLAEMAVLCKEARAICELGVIQAEHEPDKILDIAMRVKAKVSRCAQAVSKDCVQLHGAMGVTEELPIASHFRKLLWFQTIWGIADELDQQSGAMRLASGDAYQSAVFSSDDQYDSSDLAFRDSIHAFVSANLTESLMLGQRYTTEMYPEPEYSRPWVKLLAKQGWSVPLWPKEWGGTGWTPLQRYIFEHVCAQAGAPLVHPMGPRLVGPVILKFGTEQQKKSLLLSIVNGESYWCQGFSETGAGSDLASLKLQAIRDGDDYILNGSKIWTTHAHHADWMFALVRTSNEGKKQTGISFLVLRMDTPGIQVRPIHTIGGDHDVNEVFFDDVRVPVNQRIGEEGQGWDCAKYLLEFERGAGIYSPRLRAGLKRVGLMLQSLDTNGKSVQNHPQLLRKFAEVAVDLDTFEMLELQTLISVGTGGDIGDVSSILKLRASRLKQHIGELGVYLMKDRALRWDAGQIDLQALSDEQKLTKTVLGDYLNSRAYTIFGGASEIQLGIIARGLV